MIRVEFNVGDISPLEAQALIAMLQVVAEGKTPVKVPVNVAAAPVLEAVRCPGPAPIQLLTQEQIMSDVLNGAKDPDPGELTPEQSTVMAQNVAAEVEKRRPGRPSKEEAAAKKAAAEAAKNPTPAPSGAAAGVAPPPEPQSQPVAAGKPRAYSADELRDALQRFVVKTDLKRARELVNSYGCSRVADLAEKDVAAQTDFMKKCEA